MSDPRQPGSDARDRVDRHVRRQVGLKVLGDLGRWAEGVEREQRERPRVVLALLALVLALVLAITAIFAWMFL